MRSKFLVPVALWTLLCLGIGFYALAQTTSSTLVKVDGGLVEGSIEEGVTIFRCDRG